MLCKLLSVIYADYIILAVKANYPITVSVALFPFSQKKIPSVLESKVPRSPSSYQETTHNISVASRHEITLLKSLL